MRQRSNLIIIFGIAFFIVGGAIAYLVLNDDDGGGGGGRDAATAEVSVLVAAGDIEAGTVGSDVVEQGLLETERVPSGSQPDALNSSDELANRIFTSNVSEGSIIVRGQLGTRSLSNVRVPEGYEGVAVQVAYTNGGAGYVAPGDRINLFGVYSAEANAGLVASGGPVNGLPRVELALTNVLVLDVDDQQGRSIQPADSETNEDSRVGREGEQDPLTYFLALRTTDAERVVLLEQFADLYVSLTADDAPNAPDTPGFSGDNVNGPVGTDSAFTPES